ncbi:MAG: hypothetical protein FWD57_10480 [Polyangiaceae bacterium]|nr:hypothetical protein [Polyangiaceae bacterium]
MTTKAENPPIQGAPKPSASSTPEPRSAKPLRKRWSKAVYVAMLLGIAVVFAPMSLGDTKTQSCGGGQSACGSTCCNTATQQCTNGQCVNKAAPTCGAGKVRRPNGACEPGCLIRGKFHSLDTKDPDNECQYCSDKSTTNWTPLPHGMSCKDGLCNGRGACEDNYAQSSTCGITPAGGVKCWGRNHHGQLGDGTTTNRGVPTQVVGLSSGVSAISAGKFHACAVRTNGSVMCWGSNGVSQLGDGTTIERRTPALVKGLPSGISAVATGGFHTCAISSARKVMCWGNNDSGQLGDGTTTNRSFPTVVPGLSDISAISAGIGHTCAMSSMGVLYCWGNNGRGQLGIGSDKSQSVPTKVPRLSPGAFAVSAGEHSTCAVISNGTVMCWGYGKHGQLGRDGDLTDGWYPERVSNLSGVRYVSAGAFHTCALRTSGQMVCWGENSAGQLGVPESSRPLLPTPIQNIPGIIAIHAIGEFTCASQSSNPSSNRADRMFCWGLNKQGQLGFTGRDTHVPRPVGGFP